MFNRSSADESNPISDFLTVICLVLFGILLIWGGVLLWHALPHKPLFVISRLKIITDAQHVTTREIASEVAHNLGGGFFSVNIKTLREQLLRNPWVADAAFRRQWPNTLTVNVVEQKPIAIWRDKALLNDKGKIFTPAVEAFPQNLPRLSAPSDDALAQVLQQYKDLSKKIAKIKLPITALHLSRYQNWDFTVAAKIKVVLGSGDFEHRINRFLTLYSKVLVNNPANGFTVDLRYPNGATFRPAFIP